MFLFLFAEITSEAEELELIVIRELIMKKKILV
jgi:hypothetical protein